MIFENKIHFIDANESKHWIFSFQFDNIISPAFIGGTDKMLLNGNTMGGGIEISWCIIYRY